MMLKGVAFANSQFWQWITTPISTNFMPIAI